MKREKPSKELSLDNSNKLKNDLRPQVTNNDVHEAQAIFDDALVNSLEAKGALDAFDNLEVLTGERYDNLRIDEKFNAENPTAGCKFWVTFSLENNFNIKVAKFGKDSSYNQAKAAAAELYPRLTASARYSDSETEGSQISYIPSSRSNISSLSDVIVLIVFTMPIWSYGLNASQTGKTTVYCLRTKL